MKCGFCQQTISKELTIKDIVIFRPIIFNKCCQNCYLEVTEGLAFNKCSYCDKGLPNGERICFDCLEWKKKIPGFRLKHQALYPYNEKMSDYFNEFKFLGDIEKSKLFSKSIHDSLLLYQKAGFLISPIPLSKKGFRKRGFNQVEAFLESSDIFYEKILSKKEVVKKQSEQNREERLLMEQPFFILKSRRKRIKNSKILLVDDVYTTGRTLLHAYDCVLAYNPKEICSFSLSR